MDHETSAAALIAAITALITAISVLLASAGAFVKLWRRDNVTDTRVDLLWRSHLQRGAGEALSKSFISDTSKKETVMSLVFSDSEVRRAYDPIAPTLRELYEDNKGLAEEKLAEIISAKYGVWLAKHICAPLNVVDQACVAMAVMVARETELEHCGVPLKISPSDAPI